MHKNGRAVVISTGLGDKWAPYLLKPNGSQKRLPGFTDRDTHKQAMRDLENYKGKTLKRLPGAEAAS
jgi:hypothetical protein